MRIVQALPITLDISIRDAHFVVGVVEQLVNGVLIEPDGVTCERGVGVARSGTPIETTNVL